MGEQIENHKDIIARLRKEIKDRDSDVRKAATIGKQLLEENEQFRSKIQSLEQEKYSLQLDLNVKLLTVQTQTTELENLTIQLDELKGQKQDLEKETKILKQKFENLRKEKCDLEKNHEDLELENSSLKHKVQILQQQIENYQNVSVCGNDTTIEEERPDINLYITQNKNLQDALAVVQHELESAKLRENRLINVVKELEEAVLDRDKELKSYSTQIQKEKEVSAELQCEIEMLKLEQVDVNRRGNSMFGELDDRRQLVEKEYKLLINKYDKMLKNYKENKAELTQCKGQIALLLSATSKKYQDNYIEKLNNMLSNYKRQIDTLNVELNKAMRKKQQQIPEPTGNDKYDYLRVMNQQAQKKIKELENDLMTSRMQIANVENSLADSYSNLYQAQKEFSDLKIENLKLKQQIKDLTSKPDSDGSVEKKPVIEILPGFESNPETLKRIEMLTKENINKTDDDDIIPGELMMYEDGFKQIKPPRPSYRAILRNLNPDFNNERRKSNNVSEESSLKETKAKTEMLPLLPVVQSNEPPAQTENKRNVNCAQQ